MRCPFFPSPMPLIRLPLRSLGPFGRDVDQSPSIFYPCVLAFAHLQCPFTPWWYIVHMRALPVSCGPRLCGGVYLRCAGRSPALGHPPSFRPWLPSLHGRRCVQPDDVAPGFFLGVARLSQIHVLLSTLALSTCPYSGIRSPLFVLPDMSWWACLPFLGGSITSLAYGVAFYSWSLSPRSRVRFRDSVCSPFLPHQRQRFCWPARVLRPRRQYTSVLLLLSRLAVCAF